MTLPTTSLRFDGWPPDPLVAVTPATSPAFAKRTADRLHTERLVELLHDLGLQGRVADHLLDALAKADTGRALARTRAMGARKRRLL